MVAENRKKSVEVLNKAVQEELFATHQYMYFHFHCEDMGYKPLADLFHRISIREMIHVEKFAERILFLKGDVDMKVPRSITYTQDVAEMLKISANLEHETVEMYNRFAAECAAEGDNASKKMFEEILAEEEDHEDIIDTEKDNHGQLGDTFLALQAIENSKEKAEG